MTRVPTCFALALTVIVAAPAAARTVEFDIAGGPLGQSVAHLGRQARVSVGLADQVLAARRVPPLRGEMSVERALARLLRGTGARALQIDEFTYRIVVAPPRRQPLPPFPRRVAAPPPPPEAAPDAQELIVVVGSRREVPLADYPGSAMIIPGSDPDMSGATRGTDAILRRRAEVTTTHLGPGRNKIFIRGMSESSFNGVTQATVGQYFGDFRVNYNAPDPDLRLVDVHRIEILEGPQGTLYGAGALGGIMRVLPAAPDVDATSGSLSVGASATAHGEPGYDGSATLNFPVGPRAAIRASAYHSNEGGYIDDVGRGKNDVNRVRTTGGRIAGRLLPSDGWSVDALLMNQQIRGDDSQYAERDFGPLKRFSALAQNFRNDYRLIGLSTKYRGSDREYTLSASRTDQELFERFDAVPGFNFPILVAYGTTTRVRMLSAEARANGKTDKGLSWVVGAAAFSNQSTQESEFEVASSTVPNNSVSNDVLDVAIFGEAQIPIASNVDVTVGGRLMRVDSRGEGLASQGEKGLKPAPQEIKHRDLRALPTLALSAKPAHDLLLYARYQEGFRPGGLAVSDFGIRRFKGDQVRVVEAGLRKSRPAGGPIDLSLVAGYVDWRDVQGDTLNTGSEPTTTNIGDARNLFLDVSLGWRPIGSVGIEGGLVMVDSKITTGPARGDPLPGVAKVNARAAITYGFSPFAGAEATVVLSGRYTGRSLLDAGVTFEGAQDFLRRKQGEWLDVALTGRLTFGRMAATLDVTNLFDSTASRFALGTPFLLGERDFTTPLRPRTIRFGLEFGFGS